MPHLLMILGCPDQALVQIDRALELVPFNDYSRDSTASFCTWLAAMMRQLKCFGKRSVDVAVSFKNAGDHERSLDWLERGYDAGDPNMPYLAMALA